MRLAEFSRPVGLLVIALLGGCDFTAELDLTSDPPALVMVIEDDGLKEAQVAPVAEALQSEALRIEETQFHPADGGRGRVRLKGRLLDVSRLSESKLFREVRAFYGAPPHLTDGQTLFQISRSPWKGPDEGVLRVQVQFPHPVRRTNGEASGPSSAAWEVPLREFRQAELRLWAVAGPGQEPRPPR